MRLTRQRRIMLEELSKLNSHPTADEFYELIRHRLPRISLGSVYRNLDVLAESGLIMKLEFGGAPKRFDGTVSPHVHIRCPDCGSVSDLSGKAINTIHSDLSRIVESLPHLETYNLEFRGKCRDCISSETKAKAG